MHRDNQHYGRACEQIPHGLHDAVAEIWDESSGYRDAEAPLLRLVRDINLGLGTGVLLNDPADILGWLLEADRAPCPSEEQEHEQARFRAPCTQ